MSTPQSVTSPTKVHLATLGWCVLAAALFIFLPVELCGQSAYEQLPTITGGLFSNAGGLIAADQVVLKETSAIAAIRWYGFFQDAKFVLSDGELAPCPFRISIFQDRSGVPGRQISQQNVSVRVRNTGVRSRFNFSENPIIYEFTADSLKVDAINGGATVWISIAAVEAPALWLWSRSIAGTTDT